MLDPKAANYAGFIIQNFYFYTISIVMGSFVLYIAADLKARLSKSSESRPQRRRCLTLIAKFHPPEETEENDTG